MVDEELGMPPEDNPMRRRGLLSALMGTGEGFSDSAGPSLKEAMNSPTSDPSSMRGSYNPDAPPQTDRIEDDRTHPHGGGAMNTNPGDEQLTPWTPQQQGQDRLAVLMDRYNHASDPQPQQPMSLKQKVLKGALLAAPVAAGAFGGAEGLGAALTGEMQGVNQGLQRRQSRQDMLNAQANQNKQKLLDQILAEQRMDTSENLADKRLTLQERMQSEREKYQTDSQARMFGQQNQIEGQREAARNQTLKDQMAEQDKRQQAGFGEQEKLQGMRDAASDRRQAASDARRDHADNMKWQGVASKRYETAMDAEQRLSRMEASYKEATTKGDQQAMLALLTDHIGMTLGLQKGARITKDILNEATQSQPWLAKMEAKFDDRGYLSGVTLGPDQMRQMLQLGYGARDRAVQGAYDESQLYGVPAPKGADAVFGKRKMGEMPALQGQQGQGGKVATRAHVQEYARQKGITEQQATQEFTASGYKIQ